MTTMVKEVVELNIWDDNQATVVQLHTLLVCSGYTMTLKAVLGCHSGLLVFESLSTANGYVKKTR